MIDDINIPDLAEWQYVYEKLHRQNRLNSKLAWFDSYLLMGVADWDKYYEPFGLLQWIEEDEDTEKKHNIPGWGEI